MGQTHLKLGEMYHKVNLKIDVAGTNLYTGDKTFSTVTQRANIPCSIKYIGSPSAGSSEEEINDQRTGKIKIEVVCRYFNGVSFEHYLEYEGGKFRIYSIQILGKREAYRLRAELRDDNTNYLPTGVNLTS